MTIKSIKSTTRQKEKSKDETLIYCGPTLENGNIHQFSVFNGDLPLHVKKHLENPSVKELFVNPSELQRVRKNINTSGTIEHQLFQNALKYSQGGK